jgi:hypothetical protein
VKVFLEAFPGAYPEDFPKAFPEAFPEIGNKILMIFFDVLIIFCLYQQPFLFSTI